MRFRLSPLSLAYGLGSFLGLCVVAYFLYYTLQGDRGWFALQRLRHEVQVEEDLLNTLHNERTTLEHRARLLRPDRLDPDLLDEQSRLWLNYSKPGEVILLVPTDELRAQNGDLLQRNK